MKIEELKSIPLFAPLEDGDLQELSQLLETHTYPPHHTLFWMNERGKHLYIISEGTVEISFTSKEGEEVSLALLGRGAFFGEISLLDGLPHSATARTKTTTTVYTLEHDAFRQFIFNNPQLGYTLLQVMATRLRNSIINMPKVININQELEAQRTPLQRTVDRIARVLTNGYFLVLYLLFISGWIIFQIISYHNRTHAPISFADNPPDFPELSFFIAVTSFVLTIFILNSQRRQAETDRIRGEIEYQINLKSQTEVMKMQLKIDQLIERLSVLEDRNNPDNTTAVS